MRITCFVPAVNSQHAEATISSLNKAYCECEIVVLSPNRCFVEGCTTIEIDNLNSSNTISKIIEQSSDFNLFITCYDPITFGDYSINRFLEIAQNLNNKTSSYFSYSNYYRETTNRKIEKVELDILQRGSFRNDFDYGQVIFFSLNNNTFKHAGYQYAGLYSFILEFGKISSINSVVEHIKEPLYTITESDNLSSEEKQFAYTDPKNIDIQQEMETAFTTYLKKIDLWTPPPSKEIEPAEVDFANEASVIIPVLNREKTIADAVESALSQKTSFKFNVIVINNHSTDNTTAILDKISDKDSRVVHIVPQSRNLGIGGCWNVGIDSINCGKFAIQLDSDDLYQSPNTLQAIVDEFYRKKCAMVIGAYTITDFDLNPIPPKLIDHKEWTDNNGHNNALRINGLGAPRAFYTPVARAIHFPDVSYGEDYAMALRICREYKIGRIYNSIYLCRRWGENSDSNLSRDRIRANNEYKDWIRTVAIDSIVKSAVR